MTRPVSAPPLRCPKCRAAVSAGARECGSCGLIFSKYRPAPKLPPVLDPPPASTAAPAPDSPRHCPLCAEIVQRLALRCRHCGADILPQSVRRVAVTGAVLRQRLRAELSPGDQALLDAHLEAQVQLGSEISQPGGVFGRVAMIAAIFAALVAGAGLVLLFPFANGAPQEAVVVAGAAAVAIIPYCLARAIWTLENQ